MRTRRSFRSQVWYPHPCLLNSRHGGGKIEVAARDSRDDRPGNNNESARAIGTHHRIYERSELMVHRLITALIFLNAMGIFACLVLIAANGNQTPEVAIHFTRAIQSSIRMFVVGTGLPLVAWEIAASGI